MRRRCCLRARGGKDAVLRVGFPAGGAGRGISGIWRHRLRRGGHCQDILFCIPGCVRSHANHAPFARRYRRELGTNLVASRRSASAAGISAQFHSLWEIEMKKLMFACAMSALLLLAISGWADDTEKDQDRLQTSGTVLHEILNVPDDIPQDLLDKADCVVVFPSVLKAAFVVGASYGRGAMTCRMGENFNGPWGAPSMMALEGGSVGFQIGG